MSLSFPSVKPIFLRLFVFFWNLCHIPAFSADLNFNPCPAFMEIYSLQYSIPMDLHYSSVASGGHTAENGHAFFSACHDAFSHFLFKTFALRSFKPHMK